MVAPLSDAEAGGLVAAIYNRHRNSQQGESKQLLAVLGAVLEVVRAQGLEPTPTAIFAATMMSFEAPEARVVPEVLSAMSHLLSSAMAQMPEAALASKAAQALPSISAALHEAADKPSAMRHLVDCTVHLLRACRQDAGPVREHFDGLLRLSLDPRPKVRRAAQGGVTEVLAATRGTGVGAEHSRAVATLSRRLLAEPQRKALEAAQASNKHRKDAESAIQAAVADALHWLGTLRQAAPLLAVADLASLCEELLQLYALRQPLLSSHVTEVLQSTMRSTASVLGTKTVAAVLASVLELDVAALPSEVACAVARLLETGFLRLAAEDPAAASRGLPRLAHALAGQLAAGDEALRYAAANCLSGALGACVPDEAVDEALASRGSPPTPLHSALMAVVGAFGPGGLDGYGFACDMAGTIFERMGVRGAPLCTGLLQSVARVLEVAFDPSSADETTAQACVEAAKQAEAAMGKALQHLGPAATLAAVPLDLQKGLVGAGQARTWLLPIMKTAAKGCGMTFWGTDLLPAARAVGAEAARCEKAGAKKRAATLRVLELQIFQLLGSFASWAKDLDTAIPKFAHDLGAAFANRPDLRPAICHALERMCLQQVEFLREHGTAEDIGHNPSDMHHVAADPGDEASEAGYAAAAGSEAHLTVPGDFSASDCERSLSALRSVADKFLPLLFNAFLATPREHRGPLARCVSAYALVCARPVLAGLFRVVLQKLLKVVSDAQADAPPRDPVTEGGDTPVERRCAFTELALCLAGGLGAEELAALYAVARPGVSDAEASVQKKSYKVLGYLCEHGRGFLRPRAQEVLGLLAEALPACNSAARRFRLRCVKALVMEASRPGARLVPVGEGEEEGDGEDARARVLAGLVTEVVLSLKEANKKTRAAAYDLLVELGNEMEGAARERERGEGDADMGEGSSGDAQSGGLFDLVRVVLAGLVGQTPHMMSAAVMALARLLYEFAPQMRPLLGQLMPAVLMLLRSKAREVVKSVLGFCKVVVMRLPVEDLTPYVAPMLEGMLLWASDSKNRFKLKVRAVVERMARRCGFDAVAAAFPASDARLLAHIRKEQGRKQKRRDGDDDASLSSRQTRSTMARTARASEWNATRIFSETGKTGAGGLSGAGASSAPGASGRAVAGRVRESEDPTDLLAGGSGRRVRGARAREDAQGDDEPVPLDAEGKPVFFEEDGVRRGRGGEDSDESGSEDDADMRRWGRRGRGARSAGGAPSVGMMSVGGRTVSAVSVAKSLAEKRQAQQGKRKFQQHSGKQYQSKSAEGDVKGKSKLEPYAYWPLDRKLLNRRRSKAKTGKEGLARVVSAARGGVTKGKKTSQVHQKKGKRG